MKTKNIHPIGTLCEVHRLMRKLNLTPAGALHLLASALADLDRQIDEYESERDGLPFAPL